MIQPDFELAKQYVLGRLERELSPHLYYHSVRHTWDDVLPAAERLAALEGVDGEAMLLLRTAALYHDLGYIEQYVDNEAIAVRIAAETLPRFGYAPAQVQVIADIILATKVPPSPRTLLEEIIVDADLDVLGREDFLPQSHALRDELAAQGSPTTEEEWYARQITFLQTHHYFTAAARRLRSVQKQRNLEVLFDRLAQSQT